MDANEALELLQARKAFVEKWCEARGKHRDALTMDDIIAIRSEPAWKNPVVTPPREERDQQGAKRGSEE